MIRHILFDLDDTLYSVRYGLDDIFFERLKIFTSALLGLPWKECEPMWRGALKRYGTTLEWLSAEKGFTGKDELLAFVHPENEADSLKPDTELRQFISKLPCPCSVLTNSPAFHAERIIKKLELEGVFDNVFDIEFNGYIGKPHASAFNRALSALGLKVEEALFVDDLPRYVNGFRKLGGRGILLDETGIHPHYPHEKISDLKELMRFL